MDQPRIIDQPAMLFVGLETPFIHIRSPQANAGKVIGPLWNRFLPRRDEVRHRIGHVLYGVIHALPESQRSHPHELQYIVAAQVESADDVPEGMVRHQVPAATFAAFTHHGPIEQIKRTIDHIYDQWLPASQYEDAFIADIEVYDDRFCGDEQDSQMDYWLSVRPKCGKV